MVHKRAWSLLALLIGACAIPNISIVDHLDEAGGSSTSGATNRGGTKNDNQGGNSGAPDAPVGGDPGDDPTGGTDSPPAGGKPATGGTSPTGGGGTGPTPAKTAAAKFCNAVVVAGEPVALDLRIGEGANLVHVVAESGTCRPVVGRDCLPIQTGSSVPIGVYDLDGNDYYPAALRIQPGEAWVFVLYYDDTAGKAQLGGDSYTADECSSMDFEDLPIAP